MVREKTRDEAERVITFCMTALVEYAQQEQLQDRHPADLVFVLGVLKFLEGLRDQRLDQIEEAAARS